MSKREKYEKLQLLIINPTSESSYRRGKFLGEGGFARCYEFRNIATGEILAGKVVPKASAMEPHHKEKLFQEIQIHSSLTHQYIVSFHSYFEDENFIYILLELCRKRSLMEMHKRRKSLTVPEVRYFMRQIVLACKYMHDSKVIHRDLKLGNLFFNDHMEIKVGDFGLATRISHEGERKTTLCGTPNYTAPEILTKEGHSYEVDIWSLGCIMYNLLVGSPPFRTGTLKNTYSKIKKCEYHLPPELDRRARKLIQKLLHPDPYMRPNADAILVDEFLTSGYNPSRVPLTCLTIQPRFSQKLLLCEVSSQYPAQESVGNVPAVTPGNETVDVGTASNKEAYAFKSQVPKDFYLKDLLKMLNSVAKRDLEVLYTGNDEDSQDPSAVPFIWISKWVDYSEKYGFGYQLCDNSTGVFFNDKTHLVLLQDETTFQYTNSNEEEQYFTTDELPSNMRKKIIALNFFKTYMSDRLVKAGETAKARVVDEMSQAPHLRAWFRTKSAIVFHLTNGTFQANFYRDHTKIVVCPLMGAVSVIDQEQNLTVYTFQLIQKFGCSKSLSLRLRNAKNMVKILCKNLKLNEGTAENLAVHLDRK